MTFVIISGGIDLSVGSVLAISSCVMAWLFRYAHAQPIVGVLAALGVGTLCGLVNGTFITVTRLPPFIATLGMMSMARGAALLITGGFSISEIPQSVEFLGQGMVVGECIPVPVLIMFTVVASGWFLLHHTRLGRYVYALGGNERAARISGVNVTSVKLVIYSLCGFLSGLTGAILTARKGGAQPTDGTGYELDAIASAVIGGTSLMGGRGCVLGTLLGAALIGILRNGMVLLDISDFWQPVVIGAVIVVAVMFDTLARRQ